MSAESGEAGKPADAGVGLPLDLPLVPIFPLPNVVLFPQAILPLHIFEDRYKAMTRHALEGDKLIAMALLRPGWEKSYYSNPAIEPVLCLGSIVSHEQLPDGKYNFLLQGVARCHLVREIRNDPYRLAQLQRIEETPSPDALLRVHRKRLLELFTAQALAATPIGLQFAKLLATPMSTSDVIDLAAFSFLDDVSLKQSLLGEADILTRVTRTIQALEEVCSGTTTDLPFAMASPSPQHVRNHRWNPSLN